MSTLFQRLILSRRRATFLLLGISFLIFGASTINIGQLLMSNTRLLREYGWQAVTDGALWQLAELVSSGYLGMAAYVVFKTCEHRLSDWLSHGH